MAVPIEVKKVEWCHETYIEIYDLKTNKLVSRMKESQSVENKKIDIGFIVGEFSGYCDYCFDNVKNYDETGLDCGGPNCPACVPIKEYFDWLKWLTWLLWLLLLLLILYILYRIYKETREEMRKTRYQIELRIPTLLRNMFKTEVRIKKFKRTVPKMKESRVEKWLSRLGARNLKAKLLKLKSKLPRFRKLEISKRLKSNLPKVRLPKIKLPKVLRFRKPKVLKPKRKSKVLLALMKFFKEKPKKKKPWISFKIVKVRGAIAERARVFGRKTGERIGWMWRQLMRWKRAGYYDTSKLERKLRKKTKEKYMKRKLKEWREKGYYSSE